MLIWAITLGLVGLVFGSFVPSLLDADPGNMQPIVGMFFTGPAGVLLGVVLGAVVGISGLSASGRKWFLLGAAIVYAGGIVMLTVPYYHFVTWLIDGEIAACQDTRPLFTARRAIGLTNMRV